MTFLRNVLHDLVEKRLWPVAVALLIALVAVPVVLGGSGGDAGTDELAAAPVVPSSAAVPVPADKVVKLVEPTTSKPVHRKGKLLNPFVQHHQPKPEKPQTTSGTSAGTTASHAVSAAQSLVSALGGGSSSLSHGPIPVPTPSTSPVPQPGPAPAPDSQQDDKDLYRVSLKFGEDGAMKTYKDIARLTPLPSADNPFFIFLGVTEDKKSAVFLVSSDAEPTGDGTCHPSTDLCRQVTLQKHDLEYFDLQTGTAGVVQYQLEITGIRKGTAKTAATAAKLRARESRAGRDYLRQVMAEDPQRLQGWSFDRKHGLVVEKQGVDEQVGHVPAAVAAAAQGEAPEGTMTVMTVPVAPAQ
ncbi:MAG TPA: hypothetical protein VFT50_12975 [Baekduia sp.]|nr:hypothetical protein [Baekduia sp.]